MAKRDAQERVEYRVREVCKALELLGAGEKVLFYFGADQCNALRETFKVRITAGGWTSLLEDRTVTFARLNLFQLANFTRGLDKALERANDEIPGFERALKDASRNL